MLSKLAWGSQVPSYSPLTLFFPKVRNSDQRLGGVTVVAEIRTHSILLQGLGAGEGLWLQKNGDGRGLRGGGAKRRTG